MHAVTDDEVLADPEFVPRARSVLEAGGDDLALHLRGHGTSPRRLLTLCDDLLPAARAVGALVLVNDRVDIALAAGADGTHLREDSLPVEAARSVLPPGALIGRSVHGPLTGRHLPDFLFLGTIFPSASHPGGAAGGLDLIRKVRAATDLPIVAIGGMDPRSARAVIGAGVHGVAAIRSIWGAREPAVAVRDLVAAVSEPPRGHGVSTPLPDR